jgi:hypothetical protein
MSVPQTGGGLPTAAKVAIGCSIAFVLMIVLVCGGGFFVLRWGINQFSGFAKEFENRGYVSRTGQVIEVTEPITEPTVFVGQMVRIRTSADADISISAQVAEIYGTVAGNIDFLGQNLKIMPGATVKGDVRIRAAQVVQVLGTVEGEITGTYQSLQRAPEQPATPESPEQPAVPPPPQTPKPPGSEPTQPTPDVRSSESVPANSSD